MRPFYLVMVLALVCITAPNASGEDFSRFYRVYGYQLPMMERGDYVLSLTYDHQNSFREYLWSTDDEPSTVDYRDRTFHLNAAVAMTDKILIETRIGFQPEQTVTKYVNIRPEYSPEHGTTLVSEPVKITQASEILPSATLIYRPGGRFELYGSISYVSIDSENTATGVSYGYLAREKHEMTSFSFGITYSGSL